MLFRQMWSFVSTLARSTKAVPPLKTAFNFLPIIGARYSTNLPITKSSEITKISEKNAQQEVIEKVENLIKNDEEGRLFAVVHLCGKQFKITAGDIIIVQGYWPPTCGDKLTLDKVLLAGGEKFSLIGRPLLQKGLVNIEATVIEKCLSHTKTHFRKKRRKQYMRINFYRQEHTMLMINSIDVMEKLSLPPKNDADLSIF